MNKQIADIQTKAHDQQVAARNRLIEQLQNKLKNEVINAEEADLLRLTLEFLGDWQLPHSPPYVTPQTAKAAQLEALKWNLQRCIVHLERIAGQGDTIAIKVYVNLVHESVKNLNSLASKHQEIISTSACAPTGV